jgi:hypothetical protein
MALVHMLPFKPYSLPHNEISAGPESVKEDILFRNHFLRQEKDLKPRQSVGILYTGRIFHIITHPAFGLYYQEIPCAIFSLCLFFKDFSLFFLPQIV